MSSKHTKRALLSSVLSLVLCFSMLLGATFAWFTDTASTAVNSIQAGTLDVALEMASGMNDDGTISWVNAEGKTLNFKKAAAAPAGEAILWEPGCTYELPAFRIVNNGNLALKYAVKFTLTGGDAKLAEVLDVYISRDSGVSALSLTGPTTEPAFVGTLKDVLAANYEGFAHGELEAGEYDYANGQTVYVHMQESAGNEYQGLKIDGIAVTVYATQLDAEYDSFDNTYDASAPLPGVWDGAEPSAEEQPAVADDGVYHISTAAQFINYINAVGDASPFTFDVRYDNAKVALDCDIDLGGYEFTRTGVSWPFAGQFDGQGYTVSNFKITRTDGKLYTALFGYTNTDEGDPYIMNLTVKNAVVSSNGGQVAVIAPGLNGGTVENCHAINCTVSGEKKVGAVVGYAAGATVKDCSAKDCTVLVSRDDSAEATLFGYDNGATFANNLDKGGNTLVSGATNVSLVSSASELGAAFSAIAAMTSSSSATVVLTSDIDMSSISTSYGMNYKNITIIGNGHTLKNQTNPLFSHAGSGNITVSDVTFKNANVDANYDGSDDSRPRSAGVVLGEFECNGGGTIKIENCKVVDSTIKAYKYAGAFVGYAANGAAGINFTNCTVTNTTVKTSDSSVGGFIGHTYATTDITNCTIGGNSSVGCDDNRGGSAAKAGWFVGTVNGQTTTFSGCTNSSTGTLTNVNAAAPLYNGFVGRTADSGAVAGLS